MIHEDSVISIAFSPDGKYLATASEDKDRTAQVWELPVGWVGRLEIQFEKEITQRYVEAISLSPNGNFLATAGRDYTARVWDLTGESANVWQKDRLAHDDYVVSVAFSPDGRYLATASWDKTARVWDLTNAQQVMRIPHESEVDAVAFNPDGSLLATASSDKMVQVWDLPSGRMVAPPLKPEGAIRALTFSPDGKYLAAAGEGKASLLWEVPSGRRIASMIHTGSVTGVGFSPDGRYLATVDHETVSVWITPSGKKEAQMPGDGLVKAMAFSSDGKLLATAGLSGANVWDIATGQKIGSIRPSYPIEVITFSWDRKYLVALGTDKKVRLWRLLWPEDLINEACQRLTVVACEPSAAMEPPRLSSVLFPIVSTLASTLPGYFGSKAFAQEDVRPPVTPAVQGIIKASSYRVQVRRNGGLVSFSALNEDGTEAGRTDPSGVGVILAPGTYDLRADQLEVKKIILPPSCVPSLTEVDLFAERLVNPRNANLWLAYEDGPLRRDYNSRTVYNGPLGFGWTLGSSRWAFGSRLERGREGGLEIIEIDGHMTVYQGNTTALHISSDPFHNILVEEPGRLIRKMRDHGYQKRYGPDVKLEVFDSQGRLRSVQYWNGEASWMYYRGGSMQAQAIVNQWTGETMLSFDWKNNHIVKARDSAGQSFQYGYEGDQLVSVTAPDGSITRYRYDNFHNLIEIVTPQGDRRIFDYDQRRDWLVRMQVAGMDYRFKYGQESVHHYWTIRTDNRGNLVRWDFHDDTEQTLMTTAKCLDEKPS
jgi:YD repeat-containing protein